MAKRPRALIAANVPAELLEKIERDNEIVRASKPAPPAEEMAALLPTVEGVLTTIGVRYDKALLAGCPHLRIISNVAVGYDNVDVAAASARGIVVCNTPGVLDGAVADLTFALLLGLARGVVAGDRHVRSGTWRSAPFPLARDIRGKTLGILGMGRIGRLVAEAGRAFRMTVIYHNRRRAAVEEAAIASFRERDDLFREADFVSVHIPATAETRQSIGAREFALMKNSAYFLNTSRGSVIDEAALIEALRGGEIAGAGLDVMAREPVQADDPLLDAPNLVLLPHIGSATAETRRAMMELAVDNLLLGLARTRPKAMVNPEIWR